MIKEKVFKIIRLLLFVALIFLISAFVNFLTYSPTEYHRLQNHELGNKNAYDLVAFGSSDCRVNFDPQAAEEVLGFKCFNYGGSATTYYSGGVQASFENALMTQSPKIVLFFVPYDLFSIPQEEMDNEAEQIFIHSTFDMRNRFAKFKYWCTASENSGAIERAFPWLVLLEDADVEYNVEKKLEKPYWNYDVEWRNELNSSQPYKGNGFVPYKKGDMEDWDIISKTEDIDLNQFDELDGYDLEKLLKKCKRKKIEAYVVMQPKYRGMITHRDYLTSKRIEKIANEYGAYFVDANMLMDKNIRLDASKWNSVSHLCYDGATEYTRILCKVIANKDKAEYYPDYETYVESLY